MARPRIHPSSVVDGSAPTAKNVVPSNTEQFPYVARSLYVGSQGNLIVVTLLGDVVYYANYIGRLPVNTIQVLASHVDYGPTSAGDIVAEF
jgi:hypothetical protein